MRVAQVRVSVEACVVGQTSWPPAVIRLSVSGDECREVWVEVLKAGVALREALWT